MTTEMRIVLVMCISSFCHEYVHIFMCVYIFMFFCVYICKYTHGKCFFFFLALILLHNDLMSYLSIQQIWETQQWPQNWKRSVFIPIPKNSNAKEYSNYCTIALISHASKVMLKISKPGFSNMWTMKFQMFKLVLEKAEEPEIKLPTYVGSSKKQQSSRKTSISALLTMPKPIDCVDHNKLKNS